MLALMIAAGAFDAGTEVPVGEIVATADCTVKAVRAQPETQAGTGMPLGAPIWAQPFDPGDHVPYAFDFSELLADDEKLDAIVSIRLSSTAAALGITIDQASGYAPVIDAASEAIVQVWLLVDGGMQAAQQFDASGARIAVLFRVRTDANPPRRLERSGVLIVRQQ